MQTKHVYFNEEEVLKHIKHYLPTQAPLKDFIHHNTLHAFQEYHFFDALQMATEIFGYKTLLTLDEYLSLYSNGKINDQIVETVICRNKGEANLANWKHKLFNSKESVQYVGRIGNLRKKWREIYNIKIDKTVQTKLIRIINSYLDQGIAIHNFPTHDNGLLASIKEIEKASFISFFENTRSKNLLFNDDVSIAMLLGILVGSEDLFEQYLFDQQFAHSGWSGMVSYVEDHPHTLFDAKKITLKEFIILELLFEIDTLDSLLNNDWKPLSFLLNELPTPLFEATTYNESFEILTIWHEAFELSYYDEVLKGISVSLNQYNPLEIESKPSFQSIFCIDDRECSIRRQIERIDKSAKTFGTAGFFGVEFYYQPINGKFNNKLCPASIEPKYLIKEIGESKKNTKYYYINKSSHSLLKGWILSHVLGLLSVLKLAMNIFRPRMSPATNSSFKHVDVNAQLIIENKNEYKPINNLQLGFKVNEMADRVENLLRSIGLIENFASIVYFVGHGATSTNNTHYAGYDCGACSGRPGSVNSKVISYMANHKSVREILRQRKIEIPENTQFIAALHDTTRDEIIFYDETLLSDSNWAAHLKNKEIFNIALKRNAKERARRFETVHSKQSLDALYKKVKLRSVSLYEPRPELNHATNALCIVGRRSLTKNLFLDRRAFLNSYDYTTDVSGKYLISILKAVAPVCGGINLEYYFSRVDNYKLGAGTKLPHNVIGLIGVANGINGDLRTGLPSQMIEVHDPVRLMVIVEHFPDVVLSTIKSNDETFEWFKNNWIHLVVVNPENKKLYKLHTNHFVEYKPISDKVRMLENQDKIFEVESDNLPIYIID